MHSIDLLPRHLAIVLVLLASSTATAGGIVDWNYHEHTKIAWRSYGTEAFDEARRTGRPLFVLVYSDQCHWCRKYELEALEQPQVRDLLEKQFVPVAVDNDRQKALGRQLGARLVPTSLILAPDGKKLLRFYGVQPAADLADTLAKTLVLWRRGELPQPDFGSADTCCPVTDDNADSNRLPGLQGGSRGNSSGSRP